MKSELDDFLEHFERYRAVTLQVFQIVSDEDLSWRPAPEHYTLGQQLLHIAQAEDLYAHGLFQGDWNYDRVRFPTSFPKCAEIQGFFREVRDFTRQQLKPVTPAQLGAVVRIPDSPLEHSLRSWLWFMLEHELHHKGQIWVYLRQLGRTPPFYAMPLAPGERPDIAAREQLGGFQ